MTDINSTPDRIRRKGGSATAEAASQAGVQAGVQAGAQAGLRAPDAADPDLVAMVELLFFAYRGFTAEPDRILAEIGFGRAHHRVLHFVNRNPGLRVADLLDLLRITKQSLARVLKQLIDEGYVLQARPANDRRERRLYLTETGRALAERLLTLQTERIAAALTIAGTGARHVAGQFLLAVVADSERTGVRQLVAGEAGQTGTNKGEDA